METRAAVELLIQEGYLPSPDFLTDSSLDTSRFLHSLQQRILTKEKPVILHRDFFTLLTHDQPLDINWLAFEKSRALFEKGRNHHMYHTFLTFLQAPPSFQAPASLPALAQPPLAVEQPVSSPPTSSPVLPSVTILTSISKDGEKRDVKGFVTYYRHRYDFLKGILQQRLELQDVVSISRAVKRNPMEEVSVIGMVYDKTSTANGNLLYTLEDVTGSVKILINKNNQKLFTLGENICPDEIIGVRGHIKRNLIFCDQVFFPDVPQPAKTPACASEEVYAAFISDIHFGSQKFLQEEFLRFISWLNGEVGSEQQRALALRVNYLFVIGDIVAGVGVYPGQEQDILLTDIRQQYQLGAALFSRIRKDVQIILCPGNHDAVRAAEPQPPLDAWYAEPLCKLSNLLLVPNPCLVNIHSSAHFAGFTILMYHGSSFHYYIDNVSSLLLNRARDNPSMVLRLLLQKRHLAPAHQSTIYLPTVDQDTLLITTVPDILVSGDMHRSDVSDYNGVTIINCSCWEAKTEYQEKTGNNPDHCKVPLYNLKTRTIKVMDFSTPTLA